MDAKRSKSLLLFALEVAIYGILVAAYLFLVWRFLWDWIVQINHRDLRLYALLCLLLIIVQGLLLEAITTKLLSSIHPKLE